MDNNIDYILITTSDKSVESNSGGYYVDEHNYFFISGSDEHEALEQFLKENPNKTFSKMIIVPLENSCKFIPSVDFPQLGDWEVVHEINRPSFTGSRKTYFHGDMPESEVITCAEFQCRDGILKNPKIRKMFYEN